MDNVYELRQFKLANGDEIVCEIIQWHNEEELELVIRKPMKLAFGEYEHGVRYYAFRPWMVYQENPEELIILNGNHVVGICEPSGPLITQYKEALDEMSKAYVERMEQHEEEMKDKSKYKNMTDKLKEFLKQANEEAKVVSSVDSSDNNVLQFDPSKRTLH